MKNSTSHETSVSTSKKTTRKQRILAGLVAFFLLFSSVAVYVLIIITRSGGTSSASSELADEILNSYEEKSAEYEAKNAEFGDSTQSVRNDNLEELVSLRSEVKAYNAESANEGLVMKDIKIGSGKELTDESIGYGIFYIGWCADETVFDSSLDNFDSPSSLKAPLPVTATGQLVEGMYKGINGMRVGGVRKITIPSELGYGDQDAGICDGAGSPLKFVVKTVSLSEESLNIAVELNIIQTDLSNLYMKYLYASNGLQMGE